MNENKSPNNIKEQENMISIPTTKLVEIFNLLYSINVHGDAVKVIAYIEQTLEQYLNPKQSKVS